MSELPARTAVPTSDTWNLKPLFKDLAAWESELAAIESRLPEINQFRGRLGEAAATLEGALTCYLGLSQALEKLYTYAHLLSDGDTTDSTALGCMQRAMNLYTRFGGASSYLSPELLALDPAHLESLLADQKLAPFRRFITDVVRYRPHTLSAPEEELLAKAGEVFGASFQVFSQLNNADLTFGKVFDGQEERPLSHGSYALFLKNRDRQVRETAYRQYYQRFDEHKFTIAAAFTGSVKRDVYLANVKRYSSALKAGIFGDNAPVSVYNNLVDTVSANLAPLHRYYELRERILAVKPAYIYDTYVPIVPEVKAKHRYEEGVRLIVDSLAPLGDDYRAILEAGLTKDRWVDRYENKGKRSGAYSSGSYESAPYILMNYKEENLNDVFTLAHEAGHSMHSYFSRKHQSYQDHGYTIFVAEVASTFNEQLLMRHLREVYKNDPAMLAFLINQQIDDIKATFFRQTMFAEFERTVHQAAEQHQPLTVDQYRETYGTLLRKYFGKAVTITEIDTLEYSRIPHFYSAFYVYKYATGLSAAIALSNKVLAEGAPAVERYLNFLKAGCTKHPLDLLRDAGVDLEKPASIQGTIATFEGLLTELEQLL